VRPRRMRMGTSELCLLRSNESNKVFVRQPVGWGWEDHKLTVSNPHLNERWLRLQSVNQMFALTLTVEVAKCLRSGAFWKESILQKPSRLKAPPQLPSGSPLKLSLATMFAAHFSPGGKPEELAHFRSGSVLMDFKLGHYLRSVII